MMRQPKFQRIQDIHRPYHTRIGLIVSGIALLIALSLPTTGRADPLSSAFLFIDNVAVADGGSGFIDVFFDIASGTPAGEIGSFIIDIGVAPGSGVTFTNVVTTASVGQPYVFPSGSTVQDGAAFSSTVFPATSFVASDSSNQTGGETVGPGPFTTGLARAFFNVAPNTGPAAIPVFFTPSGATTVNDPSGSPILFETFEGSINVSAPDVVPIPEPASMILLGLGLAGTASLYRSRRRKDNH